MATSSRTWSRASVGAGTNSPQNRGNAQCAPEAHQIDLPLRREQVLHPRWRIRKGQCGLLDCLVGPGEAPFVLAQVLLP